MHSSGFKSICLIGFSCLLFSCNSTEEKKVREGMSVVEVKEAVGDPEEIIVMGPVYDADKNKNLEVIKWVFPDMSVILIDDTVTSSTIIVNSDL